MARRCSRCGASYLIHDRSLAGRLVCGRCGCSKLETRFLSLPNFRAIRFWISPNQRFAIIAATITAAAVIANLAQWKQAPSIDFINGLVANNFRKRIEFNDIRTRYDILNFVAQEGWELTATTWGVFREQIEIGRIVDLPSERELATTMGDKVFSQVSSLCSQNIRAANESIIGTKIIEEYELNIDLCSIDKDKLRASLANKFNAILSEKLYTTDSNPKILIMDGLPANLFSSAEIGRNYILNLTLLAKTDGLVYLTSQ